MVSSRERDEVVADVASRLRFAIARTARRLRQHSGTELTAALTAALATIEQHGPLTPSELADAEHIKRPSATRIVSRLEELALVERTPDPSDGRSFMVGITPKGADLLRSARRRKNAYLAKRLRELNPADLETLERAADVLESLLESERRR